MEERSEKPTPRKLRKVKEQGDLSYSSELSAACIVLGGALLLWVFSPLFLQRFKQVFANAFSSISQVERSLFLSFSPLVLPLLIFLGGIFTIASLSHLLQKGWVWKWKKRGKSRKPHLFLPILRVLLLALIGYFSLCSENILLFLSPHEKISLIFKKISLFFIEGSLALFLLGLCDFVYQKWSYSKRMRMTPEEVRQEKRETEGNSLIKSKFNKN